MNHLIVVFSCLMVICATTTSGFSATQSLALLNKSCSRKNLSLRLISGDQNDDFPPDESTEYSGNVDWDAEWKKVVEKDGKLEGGSQRPGKDFYKSEAEIAAIKAANTAQRKAAEVGSTVTNSLPDVRSLSGDWRFWIGILALVSVGLSLLTAPTDINAGLSSGESFYV